MNRAWPTCTEEAVILPSDRRLVHSRKGLRGSFAEAIRQPVQSAGGRRVFRGRCGSHPHGGANVLQGIRKLGARPLHFVSPVSIAHQLRAAT